MKFIDFFAGIGGFRRGMELGGHKCIGFCEFDKFAVASYTSMHLITEEQRKRLEVLSLSQRQKEILKEEYRNGEWFANDIRCITARKIPKADCWCFGFPCQDISTAGKQLGFAGKHSSLFFAVTGLIRELEEKDKPRILFIENVKNLLSVNRGLDFTRLLVELDEIGYNAEWEILNSKDFGVPQNRERMYIIGHHRRSCREKIFPIRKNVEQSDFGIKECNEEVSKEFKIKDNSKQGYTIATVGDSICLDYLHSTYKKNRVSKKIARTITTACTQAVVVKEDGGTIRRFTPKEYFFLQGWNEDYFKRAQFVNSDCQLYKQAGNGVTVPVIQAIAEKF